MLQLRNVLVGLFISFIYLPYHLINWLQAFSNLQLLFAIQVLLQLIQRLSLLSIRLLLLVFRIFLVQLILLFVFFFRFGRIKALRWLNRCVLLNQLILIYLIIWWRWLLFFHHLHCHETFLGCMDRLVSDCFLHFEVMFSLLLKSVMKFLNDTSI